MHTHIALLAMAFAAAACGEEEAMDRAGVTDSAAVASFDRHPGADSTTSAAGTNESEHTLKRAEAALLGHSGLGEVVVTAQAPGVLELRGSVASAQERLQAEETVRGLPGVRNVTNAITVQN